MPEYTSVDRILDLEPDVGSVSNLSSQQVNDVFIKPVESYIDGRLAKLYTVPITNCPVIQGIADELTLYKILVLRVFTRQKLKDSTWPDRLKNAEDTLKMIADGTLSLVDSSGTDIPVNTTNGAFAFSNTQGYNQTFDEGDSLSQDRDQNKLDDIRAKRDLFPISGTDLDI